MEQNVKKRDWVKNAAIIFLAVMLVLTFFSNTILNRTLPEVVTRYVEPGSIDSKVRISGTVSARENYDVIIDQTRKVVAVNVKVGQEVSTGDLLFTLESGDSAELESARKDLESLELEYERALINASGSDYTRENRSIELAREALNQAIEKRDGLVVAPEALSAAAEKISAAEAVLDAAKQLVKEYNQQIKEAQFGLNHSTAGRGQISEGVTDAMRAQLEAAQETLKAAQTARDTVETTRQAAENDLRAARLAYGVNNKDGVYFAVKRIAMNWVINARRPQTTGTQPLSDAEKANILAALDQELPSDRKLTLTEREQAVADLMPYYSEMIMGMPAGQVFEEDSYERYHTAYEEVTRVKAAYAAAAENAENAEEAVRKAEKAVLEAEETIRKAETEVEYDYGKPYNGKTYEEYEKELLRLEPLADAAQEQQNEAEEALAAAKSEQQKLLDQQSSWELARAEVESAQRTLEDLMFSLSEQKKSDGKSQALEALSRQELQGRIAEAEKRVEELSGNVTTEVRAKVNGTVASLAVSAGHKAEAEKTLATIEVKDLGYTLTATVTVDQAKLLHVGDTAAVSNYYWGSRTTAVLSAIQPDPKDPRTSRSLTFDIAGDVSSGDSLSFAIGEKNASYDLVVPNSAVRSDTNGSFVLMITAKNSPLGNRYFATRVDVEIIASDDSNTAVKGALSNMDSVITTSSGNAPVKNGDQVRLADMN